MATPVRFYFCSAEMNRYTAGHLSNYFWRREKLEGGRTAEGYVRCEWLTDIRRLQRTEAPIPGGEDGNPERKNWQEPSSVKVTVGTREGCEQDESDDG